jgi:hypothetical protein
MFRKKIRTSGSFLFAFSLKQSFGLKDPGPLSPLTPARGLKWHKRGRAEELPIVQSSKEHSQRSLAFQASISVLLMLLPDFRATRGGLAPTLPPHIDHPLQTIHVRTSRLSYSDGEITLTGQTPHRPPESMVRFSPIEGGYWSFHFARPECLGHPQVLCKDTKIGPTYVRIYYLDHLPWQIRQPSVLSLTALSPITLYIEYDYSECHHRSGTRSSNTE